MVNRSDVVEAAERISGSIERTPLIESEIGGTRVWLKCECLQTGGAFKLRRATNRLLQLSDSERETGVVAFSSGNHAQGIAIAAKRLGIPAVIVMPADAPKVKVEATASHGAEIIFYDRYRESREGIAAKISA
jgi:threonine dehydratase